MTTYNIVLQVRKQEALVYLKHNFAGTKNVFLNFNPKQKLSRFFLTINLIPLYHVMSLIISSNYLLFI